MIELIGKGLNQTDIGRVLERPQDLVAPYFRAFTGALLDMQEVKDYRELKSDILEATEAKAIKFLNDDRKMEAATLRDLAYAFKEIHSAGRLERGLPTKTVASFTTRVSLPGKPR